MPQPRVEPTFRPHQFLLPAADMQVLLSRGHYGMLQARALIERVAMLRDGHDARSIFRQAHLDTCAIPPPSRPMPRTTPVPAYSTIYTQVQEALRAQGYIVDDAGTMHRWKLFFAKKPDEPHRLHMYAQAPANQQHILKQLFAAGFRIDGLEYAESFLHTITRDQAQVGIVADLIQWLMGYVTVAPSIGLPPPPWRLVASNSLVERIAAFDVASTPTAN